MASTGTNGANGTNSANGAKAHSKFDPNFTDHVVSLMSPDTEPRRREILGSIIRHIHDFCREVELTQDEWIIGVNYINSLGQASGKNRNEAWRVCDILGIESLIDEINHKVVTDEGKSPTSSSIIGPFWVPTAPFRELGGSIIQDMPEDGQLTFFHGVIRDIDTGKAVPNAIFDTWQASTNGKYDDFDPNQSKYNLRGKFRTDADGKFWFYCLKPTEYSVDTTGPSGDLLRAMGRHAYRPAHIHMMITHPNYLTLTAQLYAKDDPYLSTDTVCAVKDDLILNFLPAKDDPKGAKFDVEYNVNLASKKYRSDIAMSMEHTNQNRF